MLPSDSITVLRGLFPVDLENLTARQGIDAMLRFYEKKRAEGPRLDEDGDMLLYQWGTNSYLNPTSFTLDITRQFILPDEDEPYQLSLTFHYPMAAIFEKLDSGNQWCHLPAETASFRKFVESSDVYISVADAKPSKVELFFSQC